MHDSDRDQGVKDKQAIVFAGPIEEIVAGFDKLGQSLIQRGTDPCNCEDKDCDGRVVKTERDVSAAGNCHALCMIFEQARDVEARTDILKKLLALASDEQARIGKAMETQMSTLMRYLEAEDIDLADYLPVAKVTAPGVAPTELPKEILQ